MNKPTISLDKNNRPLRQLILLAVFAVLMAGTFFLLRAVHMPDGTTAQQGVYTIGCAVLLAGGIVGTIFLRGYDRRVQLPLWACPLIAAALSLFVQYMLYAWLGVWPLGEESVMLVDMHHQYGPLLSELRNMFLEGDSFVYSFNVGLGVNFLPTFAYYLASPLNLLLVLFPERLLTEGILVITLLKNAAAAAAFAACVQYLYRRRDAMTVASGVLYASMMYMLAYAWNIMWLDVVALLPLVVLCMERMLRTGRWMAYTLTLALALFANYYIGFMLCIFLVLYMIVWLCRQPRPWRQNMLGCWRFGYGSLLGGGLSAALLVPTALALGRTSAAGDGLPKFNSNFPLFDLMGQFFYGSEPTIRSGNLPNLYCGVVVLLLLPLYFCQKKIPLRRRLSYGALLSVLLVSCTINQWDLLWHGLHSPNDLPYRFSFLVCFVVLLLVAHAFTYLRDVKPAHIFCSLGGSALYLILWERFADEESAPQPLLLYVNLLLLAIYAGVLLLGTRRRKAGMPRQAMAMLLLTVICGELVIGGTGSIDTLNKNEYFTNHVNYVDNDATAADAAAVERAQEWAEKDGEIFCRMERLPRFTCMDTALHHYAGITTFASSNPYRTSLFMGRQGYAFNGVNSYLYNSFLPAPDSLLGIRYLVLKSRITGHAQLELIDQLTVQGETRYIYRNRQALPVAFAADYDVLQYRSTDNAPFKNQTSLYQGLLGDNRMLYTTLKMETDGSGASINGSGFYKPMTRDTATYTTTVDVQGQYFAFVECRAASSLRVETRTVGGDQQNSWDVTVHEPYVIDMGTMEPGQKVNVTVTAEGGVSGNIYVVRLNSAVFNNSVEALSAGGMQITHKTATSLTGTVTASKDGVLFTSIPYDEGWTVEIDGQVVETVPIDPTEEKDDGALLAARIKAGQHTVKLTFTAKGQTLGLLISLASLLCLALAFACWQRNRWLPKFNALLGKKPTATPRA